MGTEVQSKMYLPGYYSMKGISNGTGYGSWSLRHETNSSKDGQHYGMYLSTTISDGVDYDAFEKEKLRQTIMKHESIFRHQVHELHRLYRIQRDLMNEVRNKEQISHLMPIGTSQPSRFSSSFPSEDEKISWRASSFPFVGSNYGKPSSSSAGIIQSPQSSVKGTPIGTRLKENDESLDLKFKKPQRRLFDLEVPADEYIDDETEAEGDYTVSRMENPRFNKSNEVTQARDNNLSRHTSDDGNALRSDSYSRRTHNLADLNEPVEVEEVLASASDNNLGSEIYSQEQIQSRAGSTHVYSNVWFAAKQLSENPIFGKNGGISIVHLKNESNEKERSPYSVQAGKIGGKSFLGGSFHVEDIWKTSDSSRVETSKVNGFVTSLPSDHNTSGKQVKRKIFGVEVTEGNNDSSSLASKPINVANSESSSISSWTKPQSSLNPKTIQCGPQGPFWSHGRANSTKAASDVATPSKFPCDVIHRDNGILLSEPRKVDTPQVVLPWLRTLPVNNGTSLKEEVDGSHQVKIDSVKNGFWNQADTRKGPLPSPIQDSSSTTRGHDAENRRVELSECSSVKKILGFPIFDLTSKPDPVVSVPAANDSPLKTTSVKTDSTCYHESSSFIEKLKFEDPKKGLVNDSSFVKHQIDLNECVAEEDGQLTPASPIAKRMTGIDLEAPYVVETDSDEESLVSKLENPLDSLGHEPELPHESLDKLAAEVLVTIASHQLHNVQDNALVDLEENDTQTSPINALYLLADIISSYQDDSPNEAGTTKTLRPCYNELICEDIDVFEQIILTLPEVKLEELSYIPPSPDAPKEEEEPAAPRRPRRGQARRGRQRVKDFQRDVLPGMVSLSRNEVTEDLQTIEGLVRATGGTWQSSLTLRNGSRSSGGRGRRRSVAAPAPPPPLAEAVVCLAIQASQPNDAKEHGLEETSLTGWGKRTRRPPRQRCPISNSLLPLK